MLVLARQVNQEVRIQGGITVKVLSVEPGGRVLLGIDAPPDLQVLRGELLAPPLPSSEEGESIGKVSARAE